MKIQPKLFIYGFLTWLIPFLVSFFFVGKNAELWIDETFFKSIMVVTGALVGVYFLVHYFFGVSGDYIKESVKVGWVWFAINIVLDLILVLAGFFPYTVMSYITNIGMRYLAIPIFAVGIGVSLERRK